jgi:hypothetical protein
LHRLHIAAAVVAPATLVEFRNHRKKKADVVGHPGVFDHVGLLVNEPSSNAGVLFI